MAAREPRSTSGRMSSASRRAAAAPADREHGLSRRDLLRLGASGSLLLAAGPAARAGRRTGAAGEPDRQAAAARVVHPARHERRDALGGDARPGRPHPGRALLRPQPHVDAAHRPGHLAPARVRQRPARRAGGSSSACASCGAFHRAACPRSSSVPATAAASSAASRARRSRAPNGSWGRSASRAGAACRCARCSSAPGSRAVRSTSCRPGSMPRWWPPGPTRATCAVRCRWRRRSTTPFWPTR